jgi:hypothetical protein
MKFKPGKRTQKFKPGQSNKLSFKPTGKKNNMGHSNPSNGQNGRNGSFHH